MKVRLPPSVPVRIALLMTILAGWAAPQHIKGTIRMPCPVDLPAGNPPMALNLRDQLLYIGDDDNERLLAMDERRGALVYHVELEDRVTALCYNPVGNRLYCSVDGSETVLVLDGTTGTTANTIELADQPAAFVLDSTRNRLYALCTDGTMAIIDCGDDSLMGVVEVADWFDTPVVCYAAELGLIFCSDEDMDTVYRFDCRADSVTGRVGLGAEPVSLCFNPVNNLLYCSCFQDTLLRVVDPASCSVVCTVSGPGGWGRLCCNDRNNKVYGGQWSGLHILDANTNQLVRSLWPSSDYSVLCYSNRQNCVYAIASGG